jgi:flagellar capping protein FliD
MERMLRRKFASLEVTLAQSQQVSDFLTQKLAAGK